MLNGRIIGAAAAAIALHAALLYATWLVDPRFEPPPAKKDFVRIALVPPKPTPSPQPPAPPPLPKPAALPKPAVKHVPEPPQIAARPVAPVPPPVAAKPAPPPEVVPIRPPEVVAPTPSPAATPPPNINLFPQGLSTGDKGIPVPSPSLRPGFGRLPGESAGEDAKTDAERIAARVAGTTADANARARVQAGLADPLYTKMGRAFLRQWDPDRVLPDSAKEFFSKRNAQNSLIAARLWQEAGSNYGKNGSPLAEGETLTETASTRMRPVDTPLQGLDAQKMRETYRQYMSGKFNSSRSARVMVKQVVGREPEISLLQSSGDLTIDRAAIEDIRNAIRSLQEDDEAFRKARVSVWLMRLQILINPPVPVIGVTFDEEINVPRLDLPLGRKLFKHVELEAVYDDDARLTPAAKQPETSSKPP